MKAYQFTTVACAAAMLLAAQASAQDDKCRDAVNNGSRKVHQQEAKGNRKACVKDQTGDQTACVNADQPKSTDQASKLSAKYTDKCASLPAFGVNSNVTDIINAAQEAADDTIRDIFGDPVDGLDNANKCHDKLAKRPGDLTTAQWKAFRKCVKDAEPVANIGVIEGCIGSGIAAGTTGKGQKVIDDANDNCDLSGGEAPGTEDGNCADTGAGFGQCIIDNAECEVCRALNVVTGGNADCGVISGISCPPPPFCGNGLIEAGEVCDPPGLDSPDCGGTTCSAACQCVAEAAPHKCTFDGAVDNSSIQICFLGVCPPAFDISGAIDILCDPATQGINGKRDCQCTVQALDPIILTGVGTICVNPFAGPCPNGEMDCDGGNALDIEIIGDHTGAGTCTSNADCAGSCGTYCSGIGKAVYSSGCELECQGGTRADQACICDTAGAATCTGGIAGVNDCPNGSCEGKDNDLGGKQCHCTCIDEAFGGASAAGSMNCRAGVAINVEAGEDGICDGNVIIRLPGQCAAFTSATSAAGILNDNEGPGDLGPYSETGTAGTCGAFDGSATTAYELVSVLAFYDSTIGDIISRLQLDCQ